MTYSQFKASAKPGHYDPDTDAYYSDDDYKELLAARAEIDRRLSRLNIEPLNEVAQVDATPESNEKPVKRSKP